MAIDITDDGIQANVVEFAELYRDLGVVDPELKKELRKELRAVAQEVATTAKSLASWSTGASGHGAVPDSIGAIVSTQGAGVVTRYSRSRIGPLYELGSTRGSGVVRHPLFGDREHWYQTATRPFLVPAAKQHEEDAAKRAEDAVDRALRKARM